MKINRLYIGDLGIYRNALMENISPKIVVIGGLNRSGKTTFLDILRNMPFGFPKNLRPASVEYYLECDLVNENEEKLSLRINGLKEPQISFKNESSKYIYKLYGDIDKFTYSQLYTITLDELKKLNNKNDEEKLQAVLLGAGISDIVHVPKLIDEIRKDKEKIGGKNGSPKAKLFKPYYEKLLTGVNNRDEALDQVDKFTAKEANEAKLNQDIISKIGEIDILKDQILVFEVLDNNYEDYMDLSKLNNELEILSEKNFDFDFYSLPAIETAEAMYEEYCEVYNSYNKVLVNNNVIAKDVNTSIQLLKFQDKIRFYVKNISGLKQMFLDQSELSNAVEMLNETVLKAMENLNFSSNNGYDQILNIESDLIREDKLVNLTENVKYMKEQKLKFNEELEVEKDQIETLKKELKALKNNEFSSSFKSYLFISFVILFTGILIYFLSKALAYGIFITGITSAALYFFIKQGNLNQINSSLISLKLQLKTAENKEAIYIEKLKNINIKEASLKNSYNMYKEKLMIKEDISEQGLLQYFKEIKVLKLNIKTLINLKDKKENGKENINVDLKGMYTLVNKFIKLYEPNMDNILTFSEEIFSSLEMLDKELEKAKQIVYAKDKLLISETKLNDKLRLKEYNKSLDFLVPKLLDQYKAFNAKNVLRDKCQAIEKNLIKNLSSERICSAFKTVGKLYNIDKVETLEYFYSMLNIYPVKVEIQNELVNLEIKLKEANGKLEALKKEMQMVKFELDTLATSSKLQEAQALIDEGRLSLKPMAVKYSVLSAAEYILETVQNEFLDNAKHKLLNGAGEIFSKITSGEYKAVLPGDNLLQADFKAVEAQGKVEENTSILSRGTIEQLFLSVRLNRIKAIKEKLPIIFDDPFVNFDDSHVKNTLKLITELSENNQIFILTCHGEVIKQIETIESDVQYWKLNKGKFELTNSEELIDHLTKNMNTEDVIIDNCCVR
ncbi:AAA family ATPase [Candidatus Clostridium stratigraminis]|uniref:AAA family ATPase n=1 Tax=Candidatus Clostridium stratigraminis TaxID=3381661 RepID=A0ABW8T733_9CLOT